MLQYLLVAYGNMAGATLSTQGRSILCCSHTGDIQSRQLQCLLFEIYLKTIWKVWVLENVARPLFKEARQSKSVALMLCWLHCLLIFVASTYFAIDLVLASQDANQSLSFLATCILGHQFSLTWANWLCWLGMMAAVAARRIAFRYCFSGWSQMCKCVITE